MRRIVILGGLGQFGRTATAELERLGVPVVVSSRHAPHAVGEVENVSIEESVLSEVTARGACLLQCDADSPESLRAVLRAGDIVLDAAGPFFERSTALVEAAIEIGFDVVDLNDDLGYAERVIALESRIDASGVRVLGSASSVSAIAAAVVRQSGIDLPIRVDTFLAPASRHTANVGSAKSLWRSIGRPVRVLIGGELATRVGWVDTRSFAMPFPVGNLNGHLFESADAVNLPRIWPSLRDVAMYVDANTFGVNTMLAMAAHSEPLRELMQQQVKLGTWVAKKLGASNGGVGYEIAAADGRVARFAITGGANSFLTAVAPAVLAVRALALEKFSDRGLVPQDRQVALEELLTYLQAAGIAFDRLG